MDGKSKPGGAGLDAGPKGNWRGGGVRDGGLEEEEEKAVSGADTREGLGRQR